MRYGKPHPQNRRTVSCGAPSKDFASGRSRDPFMTANGQRMIRSLMQRHGGTIQENHYVVNLKGEAAYPATVFVLYVCLLGISVSATCVLHARQRPETSVMPFRR